jgi:hypothetical protein
LVLRSKVCSGDQHLHAQGEECVHERQLHT